MTAHNHSQHVDGCYRCELSRDEVTTDQEAVIQRANGDLHVTDELGRMASLHWSRFHGLIISAEQVGGIYLGQEEVIHWLEGHIKEERAHA